MKKKWEVKLKTRKGGLTTKRIPKLKTWKGGLRRRKLIKGIQGMESCDNQASLVCGKAEFDICSEKTKDIGRGAHSGQNLRPVDIGYFKSSLHGFPSLYTHLTLNQWIKESFFVLNNPLPFSQNLSLLNASCSCFITWLDHLHCISDFSLFMWNSLTTWEL